MTGATRGLSEYEAHTASKFCHFTRSMNVSVRSMASCGLPSSSAYGYTKKFSGGPFDIATLLAIIIIVAGVGFAALRESSDLRESGVFTLTIGVLATIGGSIL